MSTPIHIAGRFQDRVMSSKRLDSLSDYRRPHYRLRADCLKCKLVTVLDPVALITR